MCDINLKGEVVGRGGHPQAQLTGEITTFLYALRSKGYRRQHNFRELEDGLGFPSDSPDIGAEEDINGVVGFPTPSVVDGHSI